MSYATVFHPTKGIIIANANEMKVTCSATLGIGKYIDGTFLMDINVGPSSDKAYATGAIDIDFKYIYLLPYEGTKPFFLLFS